MAQPIVICKEEDEKGRSEETDISRPSSISYPAHSSSNLPLRVP